MMIWEPAKRWRFERLRQAVCARGWWGVYTRGARMRVG